ncbi:DedA family protein [Streptomyces sp. 8N114]|uniref:DedA family protein n=1 Tax=Streptomyces sp. 8N114 TaxID=3457419 RepID=UPI003FD44A0D
MTALDALGQLPAVAASALGQAPPAAAYALLATAVLAESVLMVGAFVPTLTVLLTAGALARTGQLGLLTVIAVAACAAMAGDFLAHRTGCLLGDRLRTSRLARRIPAGAWRRAEALMAGHGGRAVFCSRFVPVLRTLTPHVAGATRVPYHRIAPYSAVATPLWAAAEAGAGFTAASAQRALTLAGPALATVLATALAAAVLARAVSRLRLRRRRAIIPTMLEIPGYAHGPLVDGSAYLDQPLFWPVHLGTCLRGEEAQRAAFGADWDAAMDLYRALSAAHEWPVFEVTLRPGHTIYVVYRNLDGDPGVDYLIHHPTWSAAEPIAVDDGHFMGPGMAWHELLNVAVQPTPDGETHVTARLLLLFPALGDTQLSDDAVGTLTTALAARTQIEEPAEVAKMLLSAQGQWEPANWHSAGGSWINDGRHSHRNPRNAFALPAERLLEISTALNGPSRASVAQPSGPQTAGSQG